MITMTRMIRVIRVTRMIRVIRVVRLVWVVRLVRVVRVVRVNRVNRDAHAHSWRWMECEDGHLQLCGVHHFRGEDVRDALQTLGMPCSTMMMVMTSSSSLSSPSSASASPGSLRLGWRPSKSARSPS